MPVIPVDEARQAIAHDPSCRKLDARIIVKTHGAVRPGDDRLTVYWEGGRYAGVSIDLAEEAVKNGNMIIDEDAGTMQILWLQLKIVEKDLLRFRYVVERADSSPTIPDTADR